MKSIKFFFVALALLLFWGCQDNSRKNGKEKIETVKIGAVLPLTGRLSVIGEGEHKGILYALEKIKAKYPDKKIELVVEDFFSETKNAVTAANKLINVDGVQAIITSTTAACEAISPIVESKKIIHFVISPDVEILNKSEYNFRIYYNFNTEAKRVNDFLITNKAKSISFAAVEYSSIRKEIEEKITPFAKKEGIDILSTEFFDITTKDFKPIIAKIKGEIPDVLFLAPQVNQVELLGNQLFENKLVPSENIKIICSFTFNWRPKEYLKTLEGFYIVSPKFQVDSNTSFAIEFSEKYNIIPTFDTMYAYDNLTILAELLVKSGRDFEKFKELFNSKKTHDGASGRINFIGDRDTDVEVILTKIENNEQINLDI